MSSVTKVFKNVRIIWKNFSGTVNDFNPKVGTDAHGNPVGKRYFSIVLTEEMADELRNLELPGDNGKIIKGCNVKTRLPSNGEGEPLYTLKVGFGAYAPEAIWRVIPKGRMALNLETVGNLDHETIERADVMVTVATYNYAGRSGITVYLKKLIAYIQEDEFDSDEAFAGIPIIGESTGGGYSPMASDDEDDLPF